ncbi:MAG TPA: lipid-binding SYLF domain-containing protein [Candidatus Angelobacter sp.]|nr:lipid-binding SYLF domain-containing protein [Candidatus Angelobacter sp.]
MKHVGSVLLVSMALLGSVWAASGEKAKERIRDSATVMKEIMSAPDQGIPGSVLDKAKCVVVVPSVKKAALGVGGEYGRGVMTCRSGADFTGKWSAPVMMTLAGGSFGFQIGGQATDFVIVVMNDSGARAMLHNKLKLGADASVAAGPVGRSAEAATNENLKAEMLSYSRSRGAFAGVSLAGATLHPDSEDDANLYGEKVTADQIISGQVTMPEEARPLVETLAQAAPSRGSR